MKKFLVIFFTFSLLTACGYETGTSPSSSGTGGSGSGGSGSGPKKIFVTAAEHNGGFGATATLAMVAADAFCNADAGKPAGGGSYKALMVGSVRNTTTDWPLQASTTYYRADGTTVVGTTNSSSVFDFPLSNSFDPTAGIYTWSGLEHNWTIHNANCTDWTIGLAGNSGVAGGPQATNSGSIHGVIGGCQEVTNYHVLCVEQ